MKYWVEQGFVVADYINTEDQEAGLFTKPLLLSKFSRLKNKTGTTEVH
jgi:hypothetical protein